MLLRSGLYILVFLLSVAILANVHKRAVRQAVLLIGSYALFLSWEPWFAAVLVLSTVVNFAFGEWLRRTSSRLALAMGIIFNVALLSTFKYLPEHSSHFGPLGFLSQVALPLGISFWTFQAMSYLFDLYREEELDPSFFEFALYMAFFPVTISGPICRMPDMLPQFRSEKLTALNEIGEGLRRIAIGIFMMELAKLLGQGILSGDGINSGFDRLKQWAGPDVWCLAFGFGLQLFFDFAGYSHIAIGAAKALGFAVPENFERPFHSTTPSVFWTRWHMSLSFWIRDYVFLPLAMFRREMSWRNLVLVISMLLFGVWHKATLLFVVWGCYHGALLVLHRQVQQVQHRFDWNPSSAAWTGVSWIVTISLISLGWIFFRASSIGEVGKMFAAVASPPSYSSHFLSGSLYLLVAALAAGYFIAVLLADAIDHYVISCEETASTNGAVALLARWRWFWLPPLYAVSLLFLSIVTFTRGSSAAQLMYRRF